MTPLSTHVLDLAGGAPVADLPVACKRFVEGRWQSVGSARTDADGRAQLIGEAGVRPGAHRLVFDARSYYEGCGKGFAYGEIAIAFEVTDPRHALHLPLLLAPYGYWTYRGS